MTYLQPAKRSAGAAHSAVAMHRRQTGGRRAALPRRRHPHAANRADAPSLQVASSPASRASSPTSAGAWRRRAGGGIAACCMLGVIVEQRSWNSALALVSWSALLGRPGSSCISWPPPSRSCRRCLPCAASRCARPATRSRIDLRLRRRRACRCGCRASRREDAVAAVAGASGEQQAPARTSAFDAARIAECHEQDPRECLRLSRAYALRLHSLISCDS